MKLRFAQSRPVSRQTLEAETNSKRSVLPQFAKAISSLAPNISASEREQLTSTLQQMEVTLPQPRLSHAQSGADAKAAPASIRCC